MYLDLKDLSLRTGDHAEQTYPLEISPVVLGGVDYQVLVPNGVTVAVDRVAGGFLVTTYLDAKIYGPCTRCLTEVVLDVRAEQQEFAPTARDGWEESDLGAFIEDLVVDVTGIAREAVVLSLPAQVLCSPSCKGLCAQCGHDLNKGSCSCLPADVDERWGRLRDLHVNDWSAP
jgi:uncharacterized protein